MRAAGVRDRRAGSARRLVAVIPAVLLCTTEVASAQEQELPEDSPAAAGKRLYALQCASCHGAEGEGFIGPPIMGSGAALGPYANGERLLEYIGATMPQNNPGSLDDNQYRQLLAYLLVRNGFVDPDWSPEEQAPEEVSLSSE